VLRRAFTLLELLVVVAIIALLIALLVPSMRTARAQAREVVCRSNHHQCFLALDMYASERRGLYPLADFEMNPHCKLLDALRARKDALFDAMYCPQAGWIEPVAQNRTDYPPVGEQTSVVDTDANRAAGNISYLYWSHHDRSKWRSTNHKKYGEDMDSFRPRRLRQTGKPIPFAVSTDPKTPKAVQSDRPGDYWVMSDFFRKKAPFPHTRKHKNGLNVLYLDGHGDWMRGQPRANFK
jgi:prepilin-type N-terminal cleavage/methylation domain-containing protein/prepilin-type processing-associated H-X9-DG protein